MGLLLKLSISLSLLSLLLWRVDREALFSMLRSLNLMLFLTALLLYILCQLLSTYRWQLLLWAEKIWIPFQKLALFYFEGMFFNLFFPTAIGGDLVKGHRIYRYTEGEEASLASILIDRLVGLSAVLFIALTALLSSSLNSPSPDPIVAWPILGFAGAFVLGVGGMFSRRIGSLLFPSRRWLPASRLWEKLGAFYRSLQRYRGHKIALGKTFCISLFLQALYVYNYYLVARALGFSISLGTFYLLVPLVIVVSMIPISIGGLGVREGTMIYLFGKVGVDPASALGLSLTVFFINILSSLPGGLIFALWRARRS